MKDTKMNKKMPISYVIVLLLLLIITPICFAESASCDLSFDIAFEEILPENRCDVNLFLDGEKVARLQNGELFADKVTVAAGEHTVMFCKADDSTAAFTDIIDISQDCTYVCTLQTKATSVTLSDKQIVIRQTGIQGKSAATLTANPTPKPKLQPTPDPSPQSQNSSFMVWISETGSKYHSTDHCGRMNPIKASYISIDQAIASGYTQCSKCW